MAKAYSSIFICRSEDAKERYIEEMARKFPLTPPSGKEDGFTVRAVDGSLVRP